MDNVAEPVELLLVEGDSEEVGVLESELLPVELLLAVGDGLWEEEGDVLWVALDVDEGVADNVAETLLLGEEDRLTVGLLLSDQDELTVGL